MFEALSAYIYLFKVNNEEICSKLAIKTPERRP